MRKFYITENQLKEIIDGDLMLSSDQSTEYEGSTVSTTEPVGDDNYGKPNIGDKKAKEMSPGVFQRMSSRGSHSIAKF